VVITLKRAGVQSNVRQMLVFGPADRVNEPSRLQPVGFSDAVEKGDRHDEFPVIFV